MPDEPTETEEALTVEKIAVRGVALWLHTTLLRPLQEQEDPLPPVPKALREVLGHPGLHEAVVALTRNARNSYLKQYSREHASDKGPSQKRQKDREALLSHVEGCNAAVKWLETNPPKA